MKEMANPFSYNSRSRVMNGGDEVDNTEMRSQVPEADQEEFDIVGISTKLSLNSDEFDEILKGEAD